MKLASDVLLEIVAIVQDGLVNGNDVSQALRDLDVVLNDTDDRETLGGDLSLSPQYLKEHGRG